MLPAVYFDGTSGRAHAVTLQAGGGVLRVLGEGIDRSVPMTDVLWPERTRHGMRIAHFSGGGSVQCADSAAWDQWSAGSGRRDTWVVRLQQSWRGVLASALALVALVIALQQWGLPAAGKVVVDWTPLSVDESLGELTLEAIDEHVMRPSRLPLEVQARVQAALTKAVSALPPGDLPPWKLVFRKSRIGPNALALPGGTLIMTDELVELVGRDEEVITAVLAHELGHVRHRHGIRMLAQLTLLGGLAGVVVGDFSSLLAGVPVLMGQASYSRDAEREADAEAVRILRAARISPLVMVTLFEKMDERRRVDADGRGRGRSKGADEDVMEASSWLGIAFASHPSDADRVRFFTEAAHP